MKKILIITLILTIFNINFAFCIERNKTFDEKANLLLSLGIIDNIENLEMQVTRNEFAKMVVLTSKEKDLIDNISFVSVCDDVNSSTKNYQYIKIALDNNYMICNINGLFNPYNNITYNDMVFSALSLLSYENSDFIGNKINSKTIKFQELYLDENIEKNSFDDITKKDVINMIYNLLNTKIKNSNKTYGLNVFNDLELDYQNNIYINDKNVTSVDGPYLITNENFDNFINKTNDKTTIFINSKKFDIDRLKNDIYDYGIAICSYDIDNNSVVAYTETSDIDASTTLKKGYITRYQYNINNTLMPYIVMIDDNYMYYLENNDSNFAFTNAGNIKEGDYIAFVYNKMNDVVNYYTDNNKTYSNNDDAIKINGSIVYAFKLK